MPACPAVALAKEGAACEWKSIHGIIHVSVIIRFIYKFMKESEPVAPINANEHVGSDPESERAERVKEARHSSAGIFFAGQILDYISKGFIDPAQAIDSMRAAAGQIKSLAGIEMEVGQLITVAQTAIGGIPTSEKFKEEKKRTGGLRSVTTGMSVVDLESAFNVDMSGAPQTPEALEVAVKRVLRYLEMCVDSSEKPDERMEKADEIRKILAVLE